MKILDVATVAKRLGCSKGHVSKLINGKVKGTPQLPSPALGRKRVVIEESLEEWLKGIESRANQKSAGNDKVNGRDQWKGKNE